ncbi:hypothetical protein [Chitinophaga sancti]|uniref:Uncharacterized protein n=1 Tax=Chitinophaga sancti TaxID=1004 RepID=A0A1K1RTJ5_9BACT|nr:hypothetical protein [Chitinophaga sancti]WQD62440.1 hypothetical protein U0033_31605 [Chitinophaga sancti]WQG91991.1 hypothetical protein SR876_10780 [Chitinophaga sancti]SFW75116.1 hypothetical protein SAMN05661012_04194 [Chitinophaga sancti]
MLVIIVKTSLEDHNLVVQIGDVLQSYSSIKSWSIDLDDEDNVLRILASEDISSTLSAELSEKGVPCEVMGVFMTVN